MKVIAICAPAAAAIALLGACNSSTSASPVVACGPDNVATTNWDVVVVNNYEAAWYYASLDAIPVAFYNSSGATDPDGGTPSSSDAASAVAAAVGNYFQNGCATASANGNVVTFVLNNCTGPLGLVASTGTVTATLTLQTSAVGVQLAGSNIAANGATINLSSSGTLTTSNGQKTLAANSQTSGTGPYGNSVAHMGMYTMVWPTGVGCATINGTLNGSGDAGNVTTTQVMNYVACTNQCPQSGSAVSSFDDGGTVTLTFDGGTNAQCTATNGTSAALALQCR